jgi:hypothetical protein
MADVYTVGVWFCLHFTFLGWQHDVLVMRPVVLVRPVIKHMPRLALYISICPPMYAPLYAYAPPSIKHMPLHYAFPPFD